MIKLEHVSKAYSAGIPALNDVSLHIKEGEFVFVVGESGSGKSTFIRLLLKELEPTSGKIFINGQEINRLKRKQIPKLRRNIGVVFQDFRLLRDRNVYENVAFAQRVIGTSTKTIRSRVPQMLSMVGLAAKYKSLPRQLSGGEQQRVAIARALVNEPKILLADEPTGNLDENNAWEIMKLLEEINERGTTVVVVTHNLDIVKAMNALTSKVEASFVIEKLDFLRKGGRCSALAALGANLLSLRPCIEVKDGKMSVGKKYRGKYAACIEKYITERLSGRDDIDYKRIFITHSPSDKEIIDIAHKTVKKLGKFEEILETEAGCTVCSHCGPNTLGVLFIRK